MIAQIDKRLEPALQKSDADFLTAISSTRNRYQKIEQLRRVRSKSNRGMVVWSVVGIIQMVFDLIGIFFFHVLSSGSAGPASAFSMILVFMASALMTIMHMIVFYNADSQIKMLLLFEKTQTK